MLKKNKDTTRGTDEMHNVSLHRAARELKSECYMISDEGCFKRKDGTFDRPNPDRIRQLAEKLATEIEMEEEREL